jgi:hypothetical protein
VAPVADADGLWDGIEDAGEEIAAEKGDGVAEEESEGESCSPLVAEGPSLEAPSETSGSCRLSSKGIALALTVKASASI